MIERYKELLKKQGDHIIGSNNHSAVKLCHWLKKSVRGEDECYKSKFYGIVSHRCIQMTPFIGCNQNCIICWRPTGMSLSFERFDSPEEIVEESIKEQKRLLTGYKGSNRTDIAKYWEAVEPRHVAISLIGEPTLYPYLDELINIYENKGFTTFVVSNATRPEVIERINPTQLYLSLESFNREMYKKLCRPIKDEWDNVLRSFKILSDKDCRTVLRITLIKGLNTKPEKFVPLINMASPDFIEIKSYMHLGYSRQRLARDRMLDQEDIEKFSYVIDKKTDYEVIDESIKSRVVLLSKNNEIKRFIV
ncbi:MAG: 4-demethylwyosine synthase TYW1 [Candidatus Methanoliparum thermophilum]|uniref:S-adenosyl-L-methionine-dependent tRNA 4-demethylwyosine synthase n=1 Tax=Methanoliparum thermophilum TaxID=2491083 RepID=A0A520KR33_METT2|nr:4-demethylwyosine synthase TYW1 [Candidatus Methanoliparum sp. LAM-1]RZN64078.1 MAG: 4-demethylwyosine synthase TYW1 [Candidatus Methanoliparum thermophilum]BDC35665.1 4-demethylwyosine synthase TYW1 [Candidatus Methanoliparum sp. LAM-1]